MKKYKVFDLFAFIILVVLVGCSEQSPPLPNVTSGNNQIPVTQSTYCWDKLGCADYIGGKQMVINETPTIVSPESNINISFRYRPAPTQVYVQQFLDDQTVEIPFENGSFQVPKEKGVYYYGISAFWMTADGKHSEGDTSSVFVVELP